jgi:hypothetical protein
METMYQGGTISANDKMAVITFRPAWGDPGEWDLNFYSKENLCERTITIDERDISPEEVIALALEYTEYDDFALRKDLEHLTNNRRKIQEESEKLSVLCAENATFGGIFDQLRNINNVANTLSDECLSIETHIAVYRHSKQETKGLLPYHQ